jgi:hypothetical protein
MHSRRVVVIFTVVWPSGPPPPRIIPGGWMARLILVSEVAQDNMQHKPKTKFGLQRWTGCVMNREGPDDHLTRGLLSLNKAVNHLLVHCDRSFVLDSAGSCLLCARAKGMLPMRKGYGVFRT